MAKFKYMGTSDIRIIEKGDNFSGRLNGKVPVDLSWDWSNGHVIDTSDAKYKDVEKEVWELVAEDPEIKDVTELKKIPVGGAEAMWKSVKESTANPDVAENGVLDEPSKSTAIGGDSTTTVGGSTASTITPAARKP